jgi:hypothetical protein
LLDVAFFEPVNLKIYDNFFDPKLRISEKEEEGVLRVSVYDFDLKFREMSEKFINERHIRWLELDFYKSFLEGVGFISEFCNNNWHDKNVKDYLD